MRTGHSRLQASTTEGYVGNPRISAALFDFFNESSANLGVSDVCSGLQENSRTNCRNPGLAESNKPPVPSPRPHGPPVVSDSLSSCNLSMEAAKTWLTGVRLEGPLSQIDCSNIRSAACCASVNNENHHQQWYHAFRKGMNTLPNIGALIIRIGFWGPLYYK